MNIQKEVDHLNTQKDADLTTTSAHRGQDNQREMD